MALYERVENEAGKVEVDYYDDEPKQGLEGVVYLEVVDTTAYTGGDRRAVIPLTKEEATKVAYALLGGFE